MNAAEAGPAALLGLTVVGGDATTLERLAQAVAGRPDLAELEPFWTAIYRLQIAARAELAAAQPGHRWTARPERLSEGRAQLEVDDLPLVAGSLEALVQALAAAWRRHDPDRTLADGQDWPARVRQAFADPTLMPGQRRELSFDDTVAALALVPYLEWAAAAIEPGLRGGLQAWDRACCPICGGYPDLAVLAGDPAARGLICSRCNTLWPYRRVGCPFCQDVESQSYYAGEDKAYRLYTCPVCRRYLKTVDVRRMGGCLDPRVERLVTIGMDLAALKAGFGPQS